MMAAISFIIRLWAVTIVCGVQGGVLSHSPHHMRCRQIDVELCLEPLSSYADDIQGVFRPNNQQPIEETCKYVDPCKHVEFNQCCFNVGPASKTLGQHWNSIGQLTEVRNCLAPMHQYCSGMIRREFEGLIDGMDFLCHPAAMEIYKRNEHCLGSAEVQTGSRNCSNIYAREISEMSPIGRTKTDYFREICVGVNDFLGCIKSDVVSHCNEEAGEWQFKLGLHFLRPIMEEVQCTVDGVEPAEACTVEKVNTCIQPMVDMHQLIMAKATDLVPENDPLSHQDACGLLNNVTTCLAPIHPQCDVMMRKNFEGMTAGLEYMCNDNHSEVYEANSQCLQSGDLVRNMAPCIAFTEALSNPKPRPGDTVNDFYNSICSDVRGVLNCMWENTFLTCGAAAADWHEGLSLSFLSPILNSIDCDLDTIAPAKQTGGGRRIGIAIGLCILVMVIAGLILGLLLYKRLRVPGRPAAYSPAVFEVDSNVAYRPLHETGER